MEESFAWRDWTHKIGEVSKSLTTGYTVAKLPTAGVMGRRAYVTDALAPTFLGVLVGGGAIVCPAFDDGTHWIAG
jgi:formate/nitrite transporter FocA (FNT family)